MYLARDSMLRLASPRRPRGRRAALALSASLLALPGCDWACGKKRPPPPSDEPAQPSARVEVQNVGREPRAKLEVGRWAGLVYEVENIADTSIGLVGMPPAKLPTAVANLSYEVLRGTADPIQRESEGRKLKLVEERATLDQLGVQSASLTPDALSKLNAAFAMFQGTTTRQYVAEDGEIVDVKIELLGGVVPPPEVKKLLEGAFEAQRHFPFRLPPVAVGLGARWRFSEPLMISSAQASQAADMTLVALGEKTARVGIRARYQAPRQKVPHPLDPSIMASLDALRGDADGEITIDRLTACVLEARLTATSILTMSWQDANGKPQSATFVQAQVQRMRGHVGPPDDAGAPDADSAPSPSPARDGGDARPPPEEESEEE